MLYSDRKPFLKYAAYALLLLALFLLQTTRGLAFQWRGISPDFLPFFIAATALFEGPYAGGAFGFAGGVLLSINSPGIEGFSSLYLSLFGVLFGLFGSYYLRCVVLSALGGGALCTALRAILGYLFHDYLIYSMGLNQAAWQLGIQLAMSLPVALLTYGLVRWIHRRFTEDAL